MPDSAHVEVRYPVPPATTEGPVVDVLPGIRWARLALPYRLDHINVWLIEDNDTWTVVDTGLANGRTRENWERLFREALDGKPIGRVIVTHSHPDHIGLAGWLVERWNAEFCASLSEWLLGRALSLDHSEPFFRAGFDFYRRAGLSEDALQALKERGNGYARSISPVPQVLRRLRDGSQLSIGGRTWNVVTGSGHTPEHVCLHCPDAGVLIAGDQVLPRISPNISVWPSEPDADPLRDFLATLERLRGLPTDVLVLPSHDDPFVGLHARLDALRGHHAVRLDEALIACSEPKSAAEVTRIMFGRELDTHQLMFAVGEALAHLNHLVAAESLTWRIDSDGVARFARS